MADQIKAVKTIVEDVLSNKITKELWTGNYLPILPFTPNGFDLDAILPAVFYMFRSGKRRGKGTFQETYGDAAKRVGRGGNVSVENVAELLASTEDQFIGFAGSIERALLGDALLAFCLENRGHEVGRDEPVQRVLPTHYFSSWIDLPVTIVNLRYVPEAIVSLLVNQKGGTTIDLTSERTRFMLVDSTADIEFNDLLRPFAQGLAIGQRSSDLHSDDFSESCEEVGLDQLLTIRTARRCGQRPAKLRATKDEGDLIANRRPVAGHAAAVMRQDLQVFLQSYGTMVPRKTLLPMLEAALALGLTNILLSTCRAVFEWERSGVLPQLSDQKPWELLLDCTSGADHHVRRLAEESFADLQRRYDRVPVIMMCLRVLDVHARYEIEDAEELRLSPDATNWINLLGGLFHGRHQESSSLAKDIRKDCRKLSDALSEQDETPAAVALLNNEDMHPAWRLAEALVTLMGLRNQESHFRKCLDSCLLMDSPHGLARKRPVVGKHTESGRRRTTEARSMVLTNSVLDFLVHRHLRKAAKGKGPKTLSFQEFLDVIRRNYGLCVDHAPEGMSVPTDLLVRNRSILEKRLRDLGLLIGVNDAESMKRLRPRFKTEGVN